MRILSWIRDILISAVGGVLGTLAVTAIAGESVQTATESVGLGFLNSVVVQGLGLTGLSFLVLLAVRRVFEWRRAQRKPDHGVAMAVAKSPPRDVIWGGFIDKYGVKWRAQCGTSRFGSTGAYIDGPFCPKCRTELTTGEKRRVIRGKAEVWQCPDCGADYVRPAAVYAKEEENVEKICESAVGQAQQEGVNVIGARDDFTTEEWNPRTASRPYYSRRRSY